MLKEIFCKISDVLNSFLYTDKTSPSLKWCWSDQDLKKNKKMGWDTVVSNTDL